MLVELPPSLINQLRRVHCRHVDQCSVQGLTNGMAKYMQNLSLTPGEISCLKSSVLCTNFSQVLLFTCCIVYVYLCGIYFDDYVEFVS